MTNTYITVIPLQGKSDLKKVKYEPQGSCKISCDKETGFPIIPVMLSTSDPEIPNKVIAIRFKNSDTEKNLKKFKEELQENGLKADVQIIELEENQEYGTGVNMFLQLLSAIENDTDVYACVTYGTKIMPVLIMYVLNTLEYTRKNTQVQGVYYGEVQRNDRETVSSNLYDITSFLTMDDLIRQISKIHPEDPEGFIRDMLKRK